MQEYVVYRHGYNTANNPSREGGPETVAVARVQANSEPEACRLAAQRVTVYSGQYLSARPASEVQAEAEAVDNAVELL